MSPDEVAVEATISDASFTSSIVAVSPSKRKRLRVIRSPESSSEEEQEEQKNRRKQELDSIIKNFDDKDNSGTGDMSVSKSVSEKISKSYDYEEVDDTDIINIEKEKPPLVIPNVMKKMGEIKSVAGGDKSMSSDEDFSTLYDISNIIFNESIYVTSSESETENDTNKSTSAQTQSQKTTVTLTPPPPHHTSKGIPNPKSKIKTTITRPAPTTITDSESQPIPSGSGLITHFLTQTPKSTCQQPAHTGSTATDETTTESTTTSKSIPVETPSHTVTDSKQSSTVKKKKGITKNVKKKSALTKSEQEAELALLSKKYKYLTDYATLECVEPNGITLLFKCLKCAPRKKIIKCSVKTTYNLVRHMKNRHHKSIYDAFLLALSLKGKKYDIDSDEKSDTDMNTDDSEKDSDEPKDADVEEKEPQRLTTGPSQQSAKIIIRDGSKTNITQPKVPKITQMMMSNAVVDFFVSNFISLRVVESHSFNKMMHNSNPGFKPMSRRQLMRQTGDRYTKMFRRLRR